MKKKWIPIAFCFCILPSASALSDIVRLKDGRRITGSLESSSAQEIRIKVGEFPQVIPFELVQLIQFDSAGPAASSTAPPPLQTLPKTATLPSDTKLTIRTSDRIDSKTTDPEIDYLASVDAFFETAARLRRH